MQTNHNPSLAFSKHAAVSPDAQALFVDDRYYSYGELSQSAARIASWLVEHSLQSGCRIGVLGQRSFQVYAGFLGICLAGAAYVPLNPKHPAERLRGLIQTSKLDALLVDKQGKALLEELLPVLTLPVLAPASRSSKRGKLVVYGTDALEKIPAFQDPAQVDSSALAYIMHTSGTSGSPKGVMLTAGNLSHFSSFLQARFQVTPQDRVSQFFPLTFDPSLLDMMAAWNAGACLYVVPESELMAPVSFIKEQKLSFWTSVPSVLNFLERTSLLCPGCLPSLRITIFGGAPLSLSAAAAWKRAAPNSLVDNFYGPTEVCIECAAKRVIEADASCEDAGALEEGAASIGTPNPGMYAAVVNEDLEFLLQGERGELCFCGPQVCAGYWQDEKLTSQHFVSLEHPKLGKTRWYRTGDIAYEDKGGALHCLGRVDNQVKILGQRVELEEVDIHVQDAAGGAAAACIAWAELGRDKEIVSFICDDNPEKSQVSKPAEIKEALRNKIPSFMMPKRIIFIQELPLTPNGKTDREALIRMLEKKGAK